MKQSFILIRIKLNAISFQATKKYLIHGETIYYIKILVSNWTMYGPPLLLPLICIASCCDFYLNEGMYRYICFRNSSNCHVSGLLMKPNA